MHDKDNHVQMRGDWVIKYFIAGKHLADLPEIIDGVVIFFLWGRATICRIK
jgi:hypothetical protein